jgi:predicted RNA binding protein YcfA (HicA-like mRNA interferase family)
LKQVEGFSCRRGMNRKKWLAMLLSGSSDAHIRFGDLASFLESKGFTCRTKGDHHIFVHPDVREIINLQPLGGNAKPYQVKQVRGILKTYHLDQEA